MTTVNSILMGLSTALACACSNPHDAGTPDGQLANAMVVGTVNGEPLAIRDVVSSAFSTSLQGHAINGAVVFMASTENLCAEATSYVTPANVRGLAIQLYDFDGLALHTPTAPGTYQVYPPNALHPSTPVKAATLNVVALDATCQNITSKESDGASGTVTLTAVAGDTFRGTFDVTLATGDHLTGSFDPASCPAAAAWLTAESKPPCQ